MNHRLTHGVGAKQHGHQITIDAACSVRLSPLYYPDPSYLMPLRFDWFTGK